jgi:hypothetical protein
MLDRSTYMNTMDTYRHLSANLPINMDTIAARQLLHAEYIHIYGYNGRTIVTLRWIYP